MTITLDQKKAVVLAGLMIESINSAFDIGLSDTRISKEEAPLWLQILANAPDHIVQGFADPAKLPSIVKYVKEEIARRSN